MKAKYIGDSAKVTFLGVDFVKGELTECPEDARFLSNQFFEVDGLDKESVDTNDDGKLSIAELRAKAEEVGIDHSGMKKTELKEALGL